MATLSEKMDIVLERLDVLADIDKRVKKIESHLGEINGSIQKHAESIQDLEHRQAISEAVCELQRNFYAEHGMGGVEDQ